MLSPHLEAIVKGSGHGGENSIPGKGNALSKGLEAKHKTIIQWFFASLALYSLISFPHTGRCEKD